MQKKQTEIHSKSLVNTQNVVIEYFIDVKYSFQNLNILSYNCFIKITSTLILFGAWMS